MPSKSELILKQNLPLDMKIRMSEDRIRAWYNHFQGQVSISFSGGKDSTVLLHLVRSLYPRVPAVFVDTGLEYPEIREFVKGTENVVWLKPKQRFDQVVERYGYPIISKLVARQIHDLQNPTSSNVNVRNLFLTGIKQDGSTSKCFKLSSKYHYLINAPFKISEHCCNVIKKEPFHRFEKESKLKSYTGVMASDSYQRESSYLLYGCNNFTKGLSQPIAFWTESDIWEYIKIKKLNYSTIYDMGVSRTGCMFCMFGILKQPQPNRFQQMKKTHPKIWKYCMEELQLRKVLDFIKVPYEEKGFKLI